MGPQTHGHSQLSRINWPIDSWTVINMYDCKVLIQMLFVTHQYLTDAANCMQKPVCSDFLLRIRTILTWNRHKTKTIIKQLALWWITWQVREWLSNPPLFLQSDTNSAGHQHLNSGDRWIKLLDRGPWPTGQSQRQHCMERSKQALNAVFLTWSWSRCGKQQAFCSSRACRSTWHVSAAQHMCADHIHQHHTFSLEEQWWQEWQKHRHRSSLLLVLPAERVPPAVVLLHFGHLEKQTKEESPVTLSHCGTGPLLCIQR